MAREIVTIECTEARKEGKSPSRYTTTRNKKLKTEKLEIISLVVLAGKVIPPHQVVGEITVQCLEGRVAFTAGGATRELAAGQMLYLAGNEPHSLRGIEDASILVTILLHEQRGG